MFKKILAINFFGLVLGLISIQTIYSVEKTETRPIDQFVSNNISAENIYYKKNPQDFVEQKFMVKKGWPLGWTILADVGGFIVFSNATSFVVSFTLAFAETMLKGGYLSDDMRKIIENIAIVSGLTVGVISTIYLHKYLRSSDMKHEELIFIMKSYDPDLSKANSDNTKLFIPKEFHPVFDALWNIYKQKGEEGLKEEWNKVAELIKNKINEAKQGSISKKLEDACV